MMQRLVDTLKGHPSEPLQRLGHAWGALETLSWDNLLASLSDVDEDHRAEVARLLLETLQGDHPVDLVPHPRHGLRINPLTEAALIERIQFDDDLPELRTAPPDASTRPAVPLEDTQGVISQVVLGAMLKQASDDVLSKIKALRESFPPDTTDLALLITAPPEYPIAKAPPPAFIPAPPAVTHLQLSRPEAQHLLWTTTATARGIQTLTPILYARLQEHLNRQGIECLTPPICDGAALIWQHDLRPPQGGPADLNPGFAFLESTCRAASALLARKCQEAHVTRGTLTITAHRDIAARRSGWVVSFHTAPTGALI